MNVPATSERPALWFETTASCCSSTLSLGEAGEGSNGRDEILRCLKAGTCARSHTHLRTRGCGRSTFSSGLLQLRTGAAKGDSANHIASKAQEQTQNDQPAAAGQCASCKLQTRDLKACSNQLKAAADRHHAHTQHKQDK